jgi:glutathione S-transferase
MRGLPCDDAVVAEQLAKFEAVLDIYEAHLAQTGGYVAGPEFTMADISHLPFT